MGAWCVRCFTRCSQSQDLIAADTQPVCPVSRDGRVWRSSPTQGCCGVRRAQAVPGHDGVLPVVADGCGGARGSRQRPKVAMMVMCPPQQGQGGSQSCGSGTSTGAGGGATASNSRAREILALHAALARKP